MNLESIKTNIIAGDCQAIWRGILDF